MKCSIALFAMICIVGVYSHAVHGAKLTTEQLERIKAEVDKCFSDNNIEKDVYETLKAGNYPPPSRNWDCFSACILKHSGVMNADGSTNYRPNETDQGKQCKDLRGVDDCDTAGKIMACLHKHNLIHKFS